MRTKLIIFFTLQVNSQKITFSGTGLTNIKVENLTSGNGLTVDVAPDDILSLGSEVGISYINLNASELFVYPNPTNGNSTVLFTPPVNSEVVLTLFDLTGKSLTKFQGKLDATLQEFQLSGLNHGIYILNARGEGFNFSQRLVSNAHKPEQASINKTSNFSSLKVDKKGSQGSQAIITLDYTAGDVLKYTAVSGNNTTIMTDVPAENKNVEFQFFECKDADNNYYPIVKIGTQYWMAENLKTTKFRNGEDIPTTVENINAEVDPVYQFPQNGDEANVSALGRLYTWAAATSDKNVCPTGWHLPSEEEFSAFDVLFPGQGGLYLKEPGVTFYTHDKTIKGSGYTCWRNR